MHRIRKKEENDISTMKTEMNEACIWQHIFLRELGGGGVNDVDIILGGVVTQWWCLITNGGGGSRIWEKVIT